MLRRLVVPFVLAVLGCMPAGADAAAPGPQKTTPLDLDRLVTETTAATMADPNVGLAKARDLVRLVQQQPHTPEQQEVVGTVLRLEAECLTRMNRLGEAHTVLNQAAAIASADPRITTLDGNVALSLARIAHAEGDLTLSLKSYHKAYEVFATIGNRRGQSMALQGLGVIYGQARDFTQEIGYYTRAAEIYSEDPSMQLSIANNVGTAYQFAGRYNEALAHFNRALDTAKKLKSPYLEARILTNIAFVETKLRNFGAAEKSANQALGLLGKSDDSGWAPFIWGVKAEIEFKRGSLNSAASDLEKTFRGVDLTKTIAPFRDTHELAYKIYSALGNHPLALAHLEAFKRLDDEGRSLAASANIALMSARFDFANQKLEIEHLKTEQIRREASLKESRAAVQRILLLSLFSGAVLVIIWISWRHRLLHKHRIIITKANKELTRILGERDQEIVRRIDTESHLRLAMEAAEQANRAKTQFLANMSHELRTPLNAIIGFSEIIASGIVPAERAQEYSGDINASGRKLLTLLNDILDTARLDAGSVALNEEDVQIDKVIEQALAKTAADNDISGKDVRVSGDNSLRLRGDKQRLIQVVEKLISNAAKFTAPTGVIDIRYEAAADGGIDITVADNGIGIAADQIAHIMDHFGQIEGPYARSHGGIGLGLPIVKSLVSLHGGTLAIDSQVERGTTVRIHLPVERRLLAIPDETSSETAAA